MKVTWSCLTLCSPMDCSPTGSSVHGISQARILEWVAIIFSRGSSQPRDRTQVSHLAGTLDHLSYTYDTTSCTCWHFMYSIKNPIKSTLHFSPSTLGILVHCTCAQVINHMLHFFWSHLSSSEISIKTFCVFIYLQFLILFIQLCRSVFQLFF